jgi:glutaconate CoA-transferase subunit A
MVSTSDVRDAGPVQALLTNRMMVDGVVETPNGAHFTSCVPDHGRDEAFQRAYATAAADDESWRRFENTFLAGDESDYQAAVREFHTRSAPDE